MARNAVRRIAAVLNKMVKSEIKNKESRGFIHIKSRDVKTGSEHAFRMPLGMDFKKVKRALGALQANLGTYVELENHFGVVVVRVIEADFPPWMRFQAADLLPDRVLIGYDRTGTPLYHPLNIHMLIGGASGSGKTDLLRFMLYQLIKQSYLAKIVDMKGYSFFAFDRLPNVEVSTNLKAAAKMLGEAYEEMERRANLVKKHKNRDIIKDFQPLAVIIDEAAQVSPSMYNVKESKEISEYCDECIAKIAQKGREPKVFLIYATQRPDRTVLNPQVKANVEAAIALRTKTVSNSFIILDRPGAEQISPSTPGRCIYSGASGDVMLQVPYVGGDNEWIQLLKELMQHGESKEPNRNVQGKVNASTEQSTDRIHFAIGNAVTRVHGPEKESLTPVKGTGARWTNQGELPRQGTYLDALSEWKEIEETFTDEIEEHHTLSSGG